MMIVAALLVSTLTLIQIGAGASFAPNSPSKPASLSLKATWSNGQAVKEYQDFLASGKQEIENKEDGPSVIVRSPRPNSPTQSLIEGIYSLGTEQDIVIAPGQPLPPGMGKSESYPIYVCVPPQELQMFIQTLPDEWKLRSSDFIFCSGGPICGCIEPVLKGAGFARDSMTQLLVSGFTLPGPAGKPQDLSCKIGLDASGENKYAGESAVCGKWAGAVKERLERNGIRCKSGFYREWRRLMWEQAAFDAVFNLVGVVRAEPTTIQDVANYYEQEASDMLWQVTSCLRGMLAVTLSYGFEERLFGFAELQYKDVPCRVSDEMYPFVFCAPLDQSKKIAEYLNYSKDERGLLQNSNMPISSTKPSLMRQGNLRADGVI